MAYYTALINAWPNLTGTTSQKLATLNTMTVSTASAKAILSPSQIINAIVPADLAGLSATMVVFLTLVLQGSSVDASVGTTVRAAIQTIFAGKTTTLSQLGALVSPFDSPTQPWWQANGYAQPINLNDLQVAGGLS